MLLGYKWLHIAHVHTSFTHFPHGFPDGTLLRDFVIKYLKMFCFLPFTAHKIHMKKTFLYHATRHGIFQILTEKNKKNQAVESKLDLKQWPQPTQRMNEPSHPFIPVFHLLRNNKVCLLYFALKCIFSNTALSVLRSICCSWPLQTASWVICPI